MKRPQTYPNTTAAFEAGRRVGAREERERRGKAQDDAGDSKATAGQHEDADTARLTLDAIRAGQISTDELIARRAEVDALLQGDAA